MCNTVMTYCSEVQVKCSDGLVEKLKLQKEIKDHGGSGEAGLLQKAFQRAQY